MLKGLGVTLKHALRPSITQQYPEVKPDLPPRTRGVIALKEANCTVCYKCSRECPDWCIYIDAHKETHEPASGGKGRSMKVLDRFAIDYALCMYCGICVEVCPFDALFWSPEFEYAEYDIVELTHEKEKLEEWTYTVLPPPMIEEGAEVPVEVTDARRRTRPDSPRRMPRLPRQVRRRPLRRPPLGRYRSQLRSLAAPAPLRPLLPLPLPPRLRLLLLRSMRRWRLDQETFDRVLAELLEQGTDRRVAEGRARRAAMVAARNKAEGGS